NPRATGFLPDREQGISSLFSQSSQFGGPISRHQHTAELVDPNDQWRALFQTSSVGSPRSTQYTTVSAETDDYLFISQLLSTQSMSNANLTPLTRPQAWAKNIIGVGSVSHAGTLSRDDDSSVGSTGPAADGRIKPDLVHIQALFTTTGSSGYGRGGGTSSSTAIVAGCFGLFFQMWHEGVFPGHGGGASVFDSRAKMATAKAMMINTAFRYDWYSPGAPTPNTNMWRDRQGWGMPNVGTMYEMRDKMMIIDETDIILPLQTNSYQFRVDPGEPALSVTMVYADPKGTPGAAVHRINDLSLRVTSPGGVSYWGNNGLRDTNWSTPGGSSNTVDTVENVFIQSPESGEWLIEVIADEIVEDSHVETPALDADYSLVASGGQEVTGAAIRLVSTLPNLIPPATPVDLTVSITPGHSSIVSGTEEYHYRLDGGAFTTASLTPLGNEEYMATIPAGECSDVPEFYFSVEDAQSGLVFLPTNGAAAPFSYDIGELATSTEFAEGFEGGGLPSGWTATGLWNITSSCSPGALCDGSFFAYFGKTSTCNYSTGARATGSLTSPLIAVPNFNPAGGATLTYCYNYERESNAQFDKAHVLINGELVDEPDPTNTWDTRQIDLGKYAGQNIRIEFFFDTTDGFSNNFRGFQVDGVSIEVTDTFCSSCPACACEFDPTGVPNVCNIFDFLAFQDGFVSGDPCAIDFDPTGPPGIGNIFDFLAFQDSFVNGPCP
ncbi:MAG: S8 family serine peptidase, partial [Planctomycetes bacterium]|nr:S8 family serine peptidase [Planctomycetota bacterium]